MKFNWGTGLVIFFIIFISSLGFILYKSGQYDHSLVMDNYYEEDINYQAHYDKVKNTAELPVKSEAAYLTDKNEILITFPGDSTAIATGKMILYNPVSNKTDKSYTFTTDKSLQYRISTDGIKSGRWKLKIDWTQKNISYYQEHELLIH
jgi:nitrogen fixation protein FixH